MLFSIATPRSVVYQVVDNRTSLVVKQFPDQAVLRRRAYFRALDWRKPTARIPSPTAGRNAAVLQRRIDFDRRIIDRVTQFVHQPVAGKIDSDRLPHLHRK